MLKREYRGPPIDAREQYITERPVMSGTTSKDEAENGETVAGTSADDFFSESTENMPSHIDTEEVSDEELQAIGWALSVSISHAAKAMDRFTETDIKRIVDEHLNDDDIARIRDYDRVPSIPLDELSPKQQQAAEAFKSHPDFPDISPSELAAKNSFSKETATRAIHRLYPGLRGFDDLNESTKVGILIWAYEGLDANQTALHEKYSVPKRALGDAKRIYPDLIEERGQISESELEEAVDRYHETFARGNGSTASDGSSTDTTQARKADKEYPHDFSACYRWFIEAIADNPGDSSSEIADRIPDGKGWSPQNYYNVCQDYPHIIKGIIEERGSIESTDEIHDYLLDKTGDLGEWDIGETLDEPESEPPSVRELEIESEDKSELDVEDEFEATPIQPSIFEPEEEVVFISRELSAKAQEYINGTDEYNSVTQLARDAIRKELNGEYDGSADLASENIRTDTIEAVLELADVDPKKADAIRTLVSDE